jgi:hypothetical protein
VAPQQAAAAEILIIHTRLLDQSGSLPIATQHASLPVEQEQAVGKATEGIELQ